MDEQTMEVIKDTLTKLRQELLQAKFEAADLKEEVHNTKVVNDDLSFQVARAGEEKQRLSQELAALRETSDRLTSDKQRFSQNFNDELRKLLS